MAIAAVYVVFATATVSFVVFAVGQPVELVSVDYYEQSLQHDAHMQAIANADALGAGVRIAAAEEEGAAAVDVSLPAFGMRAASTHATSTRGVTGTGTITLYRPSDRAADRVVPLSLDADGHQRIVVNGAARGRWIVKLAWREEQKDFYHEQAVLLP
jgi:hypothetical protein